MTRPPQVPKHHFQLRRDTPGMPADPGYSLEMVEEEAPASIGEQPGWHLWGMMVGFMAAGAAILTILSLNT